MQTILIIIHLMIVLALVVVVLLQRSEGGALGIGGGGGGGMMSARGAASALTKLTGLLAAGFFLTSLSLAFLARYGSQPTDILDTLPQNQPGQTQDSGEGGSLLDQLGGLPEQQAPAGQGQQATQPQGGQSGQSGASSSDAGVLRAPTDSSSAGQSNPAPANGGGAASGNDGGQSGQAGGNEGGEGRTSVPQ